MGIWATRDVLHASSDCSLRHQECRRRNAPPPRLRRSMWHLPDPVRANRLQPETTSTRKGALDPATSHCRTPRSAAKEVFAESFLILTMHLVVTSGPQMELPRTAKVPTILPSTRRPPRPTAPAAAATAAPDAAEVASSEAWPLPHARDASGSAPNLSEYLYFLLRAPQHIVVDASYACFETCQVQKAARCKRFSNLMCVGTPMGLRLYITVEVRASGE